MKILLVCDQFPPAFAPRMGYLCKYLARNGVETDAVFETIDDTRFSFLTGYTRREIAIRFFKPDANGTSRKIAWIFLMIRDLLFHAKDRRFVKAVRKNPAFTGYDLVLCSTFRTFPLRAAARLARLFDVPLVADLRDIIEQYPDNSYISHHLPFGSKTNRFIEKVFTRRLLCERNRVLRKAAAVVSVSPWHTEYLQRFNPDVRLIYNGYDPELFYPADIADPYFRVVYTGRMISLQNRNPEWLFEAVSRMLRAGKLSADDFRLSWYVDPHTRQYLIRKAKDYGIELLMDCHDFIPASEVPALLNRSSVLLQLANLADEKGPKGIMTTKFFEALAVGKPLLLVRSDESYLADLIRRFDCGLAACNTEEIETFLEAQYGKWKEKGSTQIEVAPDLVREFSRREQAYRFLSLFEEVCARYGEKPQV